MKWNRWTIAITLLNFLPIADAASAAQQYKATLLYPLGGDTITAANGLSVTGQVGYGFRPQGTLNYRAFYWTSTAESLVELHPDGFDISWASAAWGDVQVGHGEAYPPVREPIGHALMWRGSAESVADLHPVGYFRSAATGVHEDIQVGGGSRMPTGESHALLWGGTAESVVDLNPAGMVSSSALGAAHNIQVGYGQGAASPGLHALLWRGTAESAVDLHPVGYFSSQATATGENSQVGIVNGNEALSQAALWRGTAESFVLLHPEGYLLSDALAVSGELQVGRAYGSATGFTSHATVWNGSAESMIDLHQFLGDVPFPEPVLSSIAWGVDATGRILGMASSDSAFINYAVMWTPIPEPTSAVLIAWGMIASALLAHRNRPR
jgi:hypothetical protein